VWLPPFVEELRREENRPKLWAGVWSGYLIVFGFALLATAAVFFDVTPYATAFTIIVGSKLAINTLCLVALARRWSLALELMTLNITADVFCMTAAIYYTGGPGSQLITVYVIEVAVMALLSNLGTAVLTSVGIVIAYGTMCVLVWQGVLPATRTLGQGSQLTGLHVVHYVVFAAFAIGVPTVFTSRILTKLHDRELKLQARTAELIEAGKQKSVFLASVTHELRTPIHGVQGLAELIAAGVYGPVSDKQRDAAASIKRSSQSLLHLIDDLLALVRADVGRLEVRTGRVELRELVEQVTGSVQWMLATKQLTLIAEVSDEVVESDRRLLGHILVNLVANAAKFTPERGEVQVRAEVRGEHFVLEVEDTGIGIPEDKLQVIFEAFRQVDGGDERTYGGVGLGLALVHRLCDLLAGKVEVASTVGKGSRFTVTLPRRSEPDLDDLPPTTRMSRAGAAPPPALPRS
jgi:signal transduction histidine kinase